jgi:hypothetical protein
MGRFLFGFCAMRYQRRAVLLRPALIVTIVMLCQSANGQDTFGLAPIESLIFRSPIPLTDGPPEDAPAPDWMVWREFYSSLEASTDDAASRVEALLGARETVEPWEVTVVQQEGYNYLQQLAAIDYEARQEILARFQPRNVPAPPPGVGVRDVVEVPYGTTLREILEAEGFIERMEERKESLLQAHRQQLEQLIGPIKVNSLENHVERDIGPRVRVVIRARRIPLSASPGAPQ